MSGKFECSKSTWSVYTLREHINQRFIDSDKAIQATLVAQEKAVAAALASTKEAINKAETATEKRFESVNEFRAQLADQTRTFMPRAEAEQRLNALSDKISDLADRINRSEGSDKGSQVTTSKLYTAIGVVVTILGTIVVIANIIFK